MTAARPFHTDAALFAAADRIWHDLTPKDWREAFLAHPRIGDRPAAAHASTAAWSSREQAGMESATADTARALAEGNRAYEEKFGHVFLICATGKSATDMLIALRERMDNLPEAEIRVAAKEHAQITRIRLGKLVDA